MVRRRYHFGYPGLLYILVTLLLAIGAINSQNNLLFLAFGIAIAAGIASGLLSAVMMMGVTAERILPTAAVAGSPLTIRYTVRNRSRLMPLFAVTVSESARRAGNDRAPTYGCCMARPRSALLHLSPGGTIEIAAVVTPGRRGVATFSGIELVSAFPFGLVRKSITVRARASLVIAPQIRRIRREAALNLLTRADTGTTSAASLGRGDEFYGVRDYVPGDSARLISWRATARTGDLVVREQTTPTAGTLWIVLNLNGPPSGTDRDPLDPTEQAAVLAASLVEAGLNAGIDVGFAAPDSRIIVPPGSAPRQRHALMAALAEVEPADRPDLAAGLNELERLAHRASCIVVHAGGIDPAFGPTGARHLTAADLNRLTLDRPAPAAPTGTVA